jgi:hypothetical protein
MTLTGVFNVFVNQEKVTKDNIILSFSLRNSWNFVGKSVTLQRYEENDYHTGTYGERKDGDSDTPGGTHRGRDNIGGLKAGVSQDGHWYG